VSKVLFDDHLLRDLLADDVGNELAGVLRDHEPATTNLYLFRLSKSVVSARGGTLTGSWRPEQRRELGRTLMLLPGAVEVVPLRHLTYRMAEICDAHRVSTLGAEAVASRAPRRPAARLGGRRRSGDPLCDCRRWSPLRSAWALTADPPEPLGSRPT